MRRVSSPDRPGSPWALLFHGLMLIALGLSALGARRHDAIVGYVSLAFGLWFLARAVVSFGDRRNHPEASEPDVGHVWTTSDGRRLTVLGMDGETVRCERWDPLTGVADAWVGSWDRFQELVGLGDVARNQPPRAQRA